MTGTRELCPTCGMRNCDERHHEFLNDEKVVTYEAHILVIVANGAAVTNASILLGSALGRAERENDALAFRIMAIGRQGSLAVSSVGELVRALTESQTQQTRLVEENRCLRKQFAEAEIQITKVVSLAIADAIKAERERCAKVCDSMVIGGRAWTEGQAAAAEVLFAAAKNIRDLT